MSDQNQSSLLRQLSINDGLRNKPIKKMLEEKDREIGQLADINQDLIVNNTANICRIDEMARLLDDAMGVFKAYVNVPEANALRERWEQLKSELVVQNISTLAKTAG